MRQSSHWSHWSHPQLKHCSHWTNGQRPWKLLWQWQWQSQVLKNQTEWSSPNHSSLSSMFFFVCWSCFAIYSASDSYPMALLGRRCFPSSGLKERLLQTSEYHPSPMGTHGLLGCCPGWSGWPGGSEDLRKKWHKKTYSKLANAFRSNVNSNANHTKLESPLQKDSINITIAIPGTITFTVTATVTITYYYQHDH